MNKQVDAKWWVPLPPLNFYGKKSRLNYEVQVSNMYLMFKSHQRQNKLGDFFPSIQAWVDKVTRYLYWWDIVSTLRKSQGVHKLAQTPRLFKKKKLLQTLLLNYLIKESVSPICRLTKAPLMTGLIFAKGCLSIAYPCMKSHDFSNKTLFHAITQPFRKGRGLALVKSANYTNRCA